MEAQSHEPWPWLNNLPELECLEHTFCSHLDEAYLAHLKNFTSLKNLTLRDRVHSHAGLFERLPLSLEYLEMSGCRLSANNLAVLQRLPALSTWIIPSCFTQFHPLEVCNDANLEPIYAMPALKKIDVSDCGFSEEAVTKLREKPGLTVIYESAPVVADPVISRSPSFSGDV